MKHIHLSPRLQMAADMVPRSGRGISLVDVGTDHAYLPVWLLQNEREDRLLVRVIATDLREGPLHRAFQTAQDAGCMERIDFRLCDGLRGVDPKEAEVVVIAGMGGETIIHILTNALWTRRAGISLILQPMSSMPELRQWLQQNGFTIQLEQLAKEGDILYTALLVQAGEMAPLTPAELWAGKNNPVSLRGAWLDQWTARTGRALAGMAQAKGEAVSARRQELEEVHSGLIDMKKEWESWQP